MLGFLFRVAIEGLCGLWGGWVLKTVWWWFIFPWLHVALSLKTAVGIDIFLTICTAQYIPREGRTTRDDGTPGMTHQDLVILYRLMTPLFCLGWAALYRWAL